ncbi:MAG: DNA polymerase III subunit beta [Candidatus Moranbacteria bacterium]|nr:DNA polymerase III subunit beta [Candidatus Moranbacteria bacterium]
MRITCTRENLSKAFSFLERVTGKQTSLPILSNFLLQTEKGKIKLSATNLEIGVTAFVNAKIEGTGDIVAPAKILNSFIQNLAESDVVALSIEGNSIALESGGHSMRMRGFDVKDFPIIPQQKGDFLFSFPANELKDSLQRLLPCVSVNESRVELTGVNFLFFNSEVHIAATDSFRLAEQILDLPKSFRSDGYDEFMENHSSIILPLITLQEIIRAVSPETKEVKVSFEENQVFFEIDGLLIVSRIINGKYPDYKQILPKEFTYSAKVSREELLRAVRMASVFASQMNGEMLLSLVPEKGELVVASRSSDVGENKTVLSGDITGNESLNVLFNPRYLLDGLNVLDSKDVILKMNSKSSPAGIISADEDGSGKGSFIYIAMPIRK